MNRENFLFAAVGLLLGYVIAFHLVVYVNQNQPQRRASSGADTQSSELPADHPPLQGGGRAQSSVEHATKGAQQDPKNFDAQVEAGQASLEAGEAEDAIDFFTKANQLRPGDYDTIVKLGNANFEARRYEVAERWYTEALSKKPDDVGVRSDLGLTYFLRDPPQADKAIAEFRRALQTDPNHVPTLHNLTLVLAKSGDVSGAEQTLARLEKLNPQNDDLSQLREEVEKARNGSAPSSDANGQKKPRTD
jgi:tetratricopeptide (TPR) repeat protein